MSKLLNIKKIGNTELFVFFTALLGSALFWSYFLISVSSIFLAFLFLFECELYPTYRIRLRSNLKDAWSGLIQQPLLLSLVLLFCLGMLSYFWSENLFFWNQYNRIRLQLLIVPLCLLFHKDIPRHYLDWILKIFILAGVITSMVVLYFYIKNHELYIYALKFSKSVYTPVQHIRYTALLVMAFVACMYLLKDCKNKILLIIYGCSAGLFFVLVHLLAVKGSLFSLYIVSILSVLWLISGRYSKHLLYGVSLLLIVVFVCSFLWMPSLGQKLEYVKYELSEFKQGRWQNLSDIERLVSYKAGYDIARQYPLLGVGLGDFEDEAAKYYKQQWNLDRFTLPHNEFIFQFMSLGVAGIILLLSIYYNILRERIFIRHYLCQGLLVCLFILQMFNDTLESQISVGMTVFVLIILWLVKSLESEVVK